MAILILNQEMKNFKSYRDLFKHLTKEEYFVNKIENGKLSLTHNNASVEAEYGELNKEDSVTPFNEAVKEYRVELRDALTNLKDVGIDVDSGQLEKLRTIFSFLKED